MICFRGECVKLKASIITRRGDGCERVGGCGGVIVRDGTAKIACRIRVLERRRLILRDAFLVQKHGKKTRTLNAADLEKARLCDDGEEDQVDHGLLPKTETEKRV